MVGDDNIPNQLFNYGNFVAEKNHHVINLNAIPRFSQGNCLKLLGMVIAVT